ncbi:MAG: EamA family transporter [Desulfovibrionaceae bacterium]|nr:EamA family transporter [Desulfovibrionaceae bacterium]
MKMGYLYIALATLLFSSMEIALKSVGGQFNPVQINLTRFLIGGVMLMPLAVRVLKQRDVQLDGRALGSFAFLGFLCCVISMTFFQLAVENANASVVAVLFSCNPVFVFLFAFLILRLTLLPRHVLALLLECLGIALIINPLHTSVSAAGIVFSLLAMITFALYAVMGTRQCERYSGIVVTCGSFLFGSAEMLVLVLLSHFEPVAAWLSGGGAEYGLDIFAYIPVTAGYTAKNWLIMLYICLGVTGAGFACYFMAMQATSPLTASLVFFFKPALAPVFAWLILAEPIPINMLLGIFLILLGSLVSLPPLPVVGRVCPGVYRFLAGGNAKNN